MDTHLRGERELAILTLVAVLCICGTMVYIVHMLLPLANRALGAREAAPPLQKAPAIPSDLLIHATMWRDPWARQQALDAMAEQFSQTGDWDTVRALYGVEAPLDG